MGAQVDARSMDARIAELAGARYGVVSRAQLVALGLAPGGVQSRVRRGRLHALHRGVHAVGHAAVGADARRLAARLLAAYDIGEEFTRSELEERFLALCERAGVPRPAINARVAGLEVDFPWPRTRLVAELDGLAHHHTRAAFERDRERDAHLLVNGIRVLRVTRRRALSEANEVARLVLALDASRS
jgi:hypothetical protein